MQLELLRPMTFGTGEFKPGDLVDVAHTLGKDLIESGFATWPVGSRARKKVDAAKKAKAKENQAKDRRPKAEGMPVDPPPDAGSDEGLAE